MARNIPCWVITCSCLYLRITLRSPHGAHEKSNNGTEWYLLTGIIPINYKIIKNHGIPFPGESKWREIASVSAVWTRSSVQCVCVRACECVCVCVRLCVCLMGRGGPGGVGGWGMGAPYETKPITSKGRLLVTRWAALEGRSRDSDCWNVGAAEQKWRGLEDQKETWKSQVAPNLYLSTGIPKSGIGKGVPDLYKGKSPRFAESVTIGISELHHCQVQNTFPAHETQVVPKAL